MSAQISSTTASGAAAPSADHSDSFFRRWGALILLIGFLGIPLVVLLIFSVATNWSGTVLPSGYTVQHWFNAMTSSDVISAIGRSLFLAGTVCVINWVLVIPAAYVSVVVEPRLRPWFQALAVVPFALPWIVIAAGMQLTVKELAPELFGTVGLLILTLSGVTFPYLYWAVENSLITNNAKQLSEAARMSGASLSRTLLQVIVPSIRTGVMSGSLLIAASVFGEFPITMTLIGGGYETLPLWTLRMFSGRVPGSGAELAAVSFATFALLFAVSLIITRIDTAAKSTETVRPTARIS
jgi:putative spermidine/putrescine transport system permease protein